MNTLDFILNKYNLTLDQVSPIYLNFSRWTELPNLFKELGFTIGAEVGVELGAFSKYLIQDNPKLKLYCIDSWKEYGLNDGKSQRRLDDYYERAKIKLAPYNCEIIKAFSMDAVKQFTDESLDFVYIDAAHDYDSIKEDIEHWSKKVRKFGIVSGHDYFIFKSGNDGVVKAVN
ncbi:class I SAM-dependent methyltransferase [Candidatus Microgenomates bacterium]|nr:class I SAM-dependent methyltransferase [Candidatus Microgenomates bacterium]